MQVSIDRFLMFKCNHCKKYQGMEIRGYRDNLNGVETIKLVQSISLKCKHCGKSRKLKKKREYGIEAWWFKNDQDLRNNILIKNNHNQTT